MKFLKKSLRTAPKISLVLLDWSVRESFHLLHYLSKQTLDRDLFEVIVVEYYSRVSPALQLFEGQVDTWVLLEMPTDCYYHKHLMYNVGIVHAKGEIVIICDSDAMAKPTFLKTVLEHFESHPNTILHLDQFRNNRRDMYPFNYPEFDEVIGRGCINYRDGKTVGLASTKDPIHERNYGACFCAKREDLIKIGGADEHVDFVGHICGPYDLTFRLINMGHKEVWHQTEFLYHTWHPGQAGVDNYLGPHDGRHVSTTSLDMLITREIQPHLINPGILALQQGFTSPECIINSEIYRFTQSSFLVSPEVVDYAKNSYRVFLDKGVLVKRGADFQFETQTLLSLSHPDLFPKCVSRSLFEAKNNHQIQAAFIKKFLTLSICFMSTKKWVRSKASKVLSLFHSIADKIKARIKKIFSIFSFGKVDQLKLEVSYLSKNRVSLIANLLFAKSKLNLNQYQIWASVGEETYALRFLMLIRILPKMTLRSVDSWEQLSSYLQSHSVDRSGCIIFTREVYMRFAGFLSGELDKPWIVL